MSDTEKLEEAITGLTAKIESLTLGNERRLIKLDTQLIALQASLGKFEGAEQRFERKVDAMREKWSDKLKDGVATGLAKLDGYKSETDDRITQLEHMRTKLYVLYGVLTASVGIALKIFQPDHSFDDFREETRAALVQQERDQVALEHKLDLIKMQGNQ